MSALTLRARLLVGLAVVAVVMPVVAALVTSTTRDHLVSQIDAQLRNIAEFNRPLPPGGVGGVVAPPPVGEDGDDRDVDDEGGQPVPGEFERISSLYEGRLTESGELIGILEPNLPGREYSPPEIEPHELATIGAGVPFTVDSADNSYRYRVIAIGDPTLDGWRIQALSLSDVDDVVQRMLLYQVVGIGTAMALLAAVAWWVMHLGIRPIKLMTVKAAEIADGDLTVRIPESAPDTEAGQLAGALNAMMGRIEGAMGEQERSEQRLRRFMADASHELRTPITTVRGYAELYRRGGLADPTDLDDAMRRTEQESARMGRLVEDMMTLAKLDHRPDLEMTDVDLSQLVADAAKDAAVVAPNRSVTTDVEPGLVIVGDEHRLRQVMANVVGNAVTHTPAESALAVAAWRSGGGVAVTVADTGPGMPPEVVDKATERFYRADRSRSRARGGSGLGLAIVESVVEAHGGTLDIASDVEGGTTVTITLPGQR